MSHLEAGEQRLWEGVERAAFGLRLVEVELPSKQLHAKQSEDDEEEEEQQQQRGDGLHGVQQRRHQIGQSRPVAAQTRSDIRGGRGRQNVRSPDSGVFFSPCHLEDPEQADAAQH